MYPDLGELIRVSIKHSTKFVDNFSKRMALGFPGSNLMLQISKMAIRMQSKKFSKSNNRYITAVVHIPEDQIQCLVSSVDVYLQPCWNALFYV